MNGPGCASALPTDDAHLPTGFFASAAVREKFIRGATGARAHLENALSRQAGFGENRMI
jgi:hypothetical protein